jgi:hypothetical protein
MKVLVAPNSLTCSDPVLSLDHVVKPISPERSQHEPTHVAPTPQQPEAQTQPRADHGTLEDDMKSPQVDANLMFDWDQATASAAVRAMSSPHPQSRQQTFTQAALHPPTLNVLSGSQVEAGATGWVVDRYEGLGSHWPLKGNRDIWLGVGDDQATYADADINVAFCDADAIEPSAGSGLGEGPMNM